MKAICSASFPSSVLDADTDVAPGLIEESFRFQQTLRTEPAQRLMRAFLDAGGQTREVELRLGALCEELAKK